MHSRINGGLGGDVSTRCGGASSRVATTYLHSEEQLESQSAHSDTMPFGRCVGIALPDLLLNPVTRVATGAGAREARCDSSVSSTNATAQQSTHNRANACSHETMLILNRFGVSDLFVMTFLARCFDGLGQRRGADDLRPTGRGDYAIPRHGAYRGCGEGTQH
jgi:hypothetical protein